MKPSTLSRNVLIYFAVSLVFLFGCGKESKTTEESSVPTETDADSLSNFINVKLSGVYVTSVKTPHKNFDSGNLFDENEKTYWATMPGAGPDEGIMLYFQEPQNISHIQLKQFSGSNYSEIRKFAVYINGQKSLYRYQGDGIEINQQEVSSLYIRIITAKDMIESVHGDVIIGFSFDATKSVAVSELVLYADDSRLRLIYPQKMEGIVSASSTLSPESSYGVQNLFDSRKEFAWAEGADGNGINESISIELKEKIELTALKIFNGYQRSEKHYKANTRLKSVTVSNEYSQTSNVVFQDTQGEQTAFLSTPLKGNVFKLTVQEVFAGSSYKDLVISELKLVSNDSDIIIEGTLTEGIKTRLLRKIEDTVLEQYVDRGMSNRPSGRDYYDYDPYDKSIILRSDYTFVAYNKSWNDDHSEELIADGNWEIKELNRDQAKIRVFGKLLRNSETIDYYAGNTATNQQQIFQDFLTITNYKVKGDKFIPEITNKIE